ncbi:hypothetical protein QCA50_014962 [Cerrena zonata]|uniref:Cytochrome P450 n=1 Tax=Cerrena zonata TaxID=2478898 RepID=A0AAW0FJW3_9APHY
MISLPMSTAQYLYALAVALPLYVMLTKWRSTKGLRSLPTVGHDLPLLSYISAFKFASHAREMLNEGYQKYKGEMFKIAMQDRWLVVLTNPETIEEVRKMPDDKLDFIHAAMDTIEARYTFSPETHNDPFVVGVVQSHLTKHLDFSFDEAHDEVMASFNDKIGNIDNDWTLVRILPLAQYVVSRASNRVFVGSQICRVPEYIDLAVRHTVEVSNTRKILGWFPGVTRHLAPLFTSDSNKAHETCKTLIGPVIKERLRIHKEVGNNWEDKPRDVMQSVIEVCLSKGYDIDVMVATVLLLNFVSIHNTSNSFTQALFHLAGQPKYIAPLRAEIASVLEKEDLSKNALAKMPKLDSFMRESQRVNGTGLVHVLRKTFKPVTLSNGITIPADTFIGAPLLSIQHDEELYPGSETFDPWRSTEKRDKLISSEGMKYQYVSTSPEYLAFGHGKHACPGRFFAANEIKSMLIHLIMNYDMKFENDAGRPQNAHIFMQTYPSSTAEVLFRKRQM